MPGASRFVGNCMARNPYPIYIPCHRVIRGDGTLGGFGGGLDLKQKMLDLESR
jgi:methylated-DNA-[protein]-cysteine S-methyltransferase